MMHTASLALMVALGGAIGSICRWTIGLVSNRALGDHFPWGTVFANLIGCFIIGIAFEIITNRMGDSPHVRALVITGFLGGFTTFSSFSLESMNLLQRGEPVLAILNIAASVTVSLAFVFLGFHLAKVLTS